MIAITRDNRDDREDTRRRNDDTRNAELLLLLQCERSHLDRFMRDRLHDWLMR